MIVRLIAIRQNHIKANKHSLKLISNQITHW